MKKAIRILLLAVVLSCLLCSTSLASGESLDSPTANWLSPDDYESKYMTMAKRSHDLRIAERNLETAKNDKSAKIFQDGQFVWGPDSAKLKKAQDDYDFYLELYNTAYDIYSPLDEDILMVATDEYHIRKAIEDYESSNPSERPDRVYDSSYGGYVWVNNAANMAIEDYNDAVADFHASLDSLGCHSFDDAQIAFIDSTDLNNGDFVVSCNFVRYDSGCDGFFVILATYGNDGRFISSYVTRVSPDDWSTFSADYHVENDDLSVGSFSVMLVDVDSFSPVCSSLTIGGVIS